MEFAPVRSRIAVNADCVIRLWQFACIVRSQAAPSHRSGVGSETFEHIQYVHCGDIIVRSRRFNPFINHFHPEIVIMHVANGFNKAVNFFIELTIVHSMMPVWGIVPTGAISVGAPPVVFIGAIGPGAWRS